MSVMKLIYAMMEEEAKANHSEDHEGEVDLRTCTNTAKGYTTIIPDEVYYKVKILFNDYEDLRKTVVKNIPELMQKLDTIPKEDRDYAMLEFTLFTDMYREAGDKICDLVCVHHMGSKEHADEACAEKGITVSQLLRMKMINDLFGF